MTEYVIRFAIEGEVRIEAEDADHAREMFEAMEKLELAETGDLVSDDPKTDEEIRLEIAEIREGVPAN